MCTCLGGKREHLDGLRVIAVRASFQFYQPRRSHRVDRVALECATSVSVCRSCVAKNLGTIPYTRSSLYPRPARDRSSRL
jgi:hypothetical protein